MSKKKTIEELQLQATTGGVPKSLVEGIVAAHRWAHWADRNPHIKPSPTLEKFRSIKHQMTVGYFEKAMQEWKPEMLIELAREMRKASLESWEPSKIDWAILEIAKQGPVNISELQRETAERNFAKGSLKTYREHAKALPVKRRPPGKPSGNS